MANQEEKKKSVAAIVALIVGVIALLTSLMPIINNLSAIFAFFGAIFAIVGLVVTLRGKKAGKVLAIVALIVNVVAFGAVLASQAAYSEALDKAANGPDAVSSGSAAVDFSNLSAGESATLEDGLTVTVNSIESGLTNYDGSEIVCANVTYTNGGKKEASFNEFDWKVQDDQGAQRTLSFYSEGSDELHSGTLAVGGTVTGNIYFDAPVAKVLYYSSALRDSATAAWKAE